MSVPGAGQRFAFEHDGREHGGLRMELTMTTLQSSARISWNQGRIVGPKPPLKPKHIWAIRTRMQHDGRVRDLAMFSTAIDSKLRGCDLVKLRVSDIHLGASVRLRTTIVQQKTGRPVPFELTDPTRDALTAWLPRLPTRRKRTARLRRSRHFGGGLRPLLLPAATHVPATSSIPVLDRDEGRKIPFRGYPSYHSTPVMRSPSVEEVETVETVETLTISSRGGDTSILRLGGYSGGRDIRDITLGRREAEILTRDIPLEFSLSHERKFFPHHLRDQARQALAEVRRRPGS